MARNATRGAIIRTTPPATSAKPRKLRLAPAWFGTADGIGCLLVLSDMYDVYSTIVWVAATLPGRLRCGVTVKDPFCVDNAVLAFVSVSSPTVELELRYGDVGKPPMGAGPHWVCIPGFSAKTKQEQGSLTQAEAADRLNISAVSMTRLVKAGVVPAE